MLMMPTSIEVFHELEKHEHTICISVGENHIHNQDIDCDDFHKQLTIFSVDFTANLDVIPKHFYTTISIDSSQTLKEIYQSIKTTRGSPFLTV